MGGGSDWPNKSAAIKGRVRGGDGEGDGQTVSQARVFLWRGTYHPGYEVPIAPSGAEQVGAVVSDAKGRFDFPGREAGDYFLEAFSKDSSKVAVSDTVEYTGEKPAIPDLALGEAASVSGVVASSSPILSLHLAGTHFKAAADSQGAFRFQALPGGRYWLIARLGGTGGEKYEPVRTLDLEAGSTVELPGLRVQKDSVPLFDFESADGFSALRGLTYPYQPPDNRTGAWKAQPFSSVTADGAYRGKSCHAQMKSGEFVGFALGDGYYDLSKMTALSFQVKGKGRVEILFFSSLVSNPDMTLRASLTLDSAWTHVDIRPQDIVAPPGTPSDKGYNWDLAKGKVGNIIFRAKDADAEIWLDDISFRGMDFRDLGTSFPAGNDTYP